MPSSACKKCQILQERLKQVESELRAAKQGARTCRHEQQLVEAPREQNLLMNLEQQSMRFNDGAGPFLSQPNQQVYEVPLQQIGDQDMLTQLELHQQQQQSMDLLMYNRTSDGAGPSNHRQQEDQQQQQQQLMDLSMYSRSSDGAGPSNHGQQHHHQQQSMDLSRYNTSSDGAGPSNQHEQELYEALQQESLKNDILKKLKDLFNLILQQPQKPRREMLHYIRGFTEPQILPRQQNQPSQPQPHPQQQQQQHHDNPQPPRQQNQP